MPISLRPKSLREFVGQNKFKKVLKVSISSSLKQGKNLDHVLMYGKAGVGKTSLAKIIAREMKVNIKFAQGSLLEKKADVLSLLASLQKNDVVFIDEIHGVHKSVEEFLYSAMEDFVVDVIAGPEGDNKVLRMKLPPFTLVGATTQLGKLSPSLKDRFGIQGKLVGYSNSHLAKIVKNSLLKLNWKCDTEAVEIIVQHARKTPRTANNLVRRAIDLAVFQNQEKITAKVTQKTLKNLGLYEHGLNETQIIYLSCLMETFNQKSASVESISAVIFEDKNTIEKDIEPLLLEKKFVHKNPSGRKISQEGIKYLQKFAKP